MSFKSCEPKARLWLRPSYAIYTYHHNMCVQSSIGLPHAQIYQHHNINLHSVTHSLVSHNPTERMVCSSNLTPYCHFLFLVSRILSLMQTTKDVKPHPRIVTCVNMWSVFFFFFHLLNVGACVRHIAWESQVERITLA